MEYWVIWLVIVILLGIIEAATVNLVSVWFIASGIVSLFVSLFCDSFFIQFGIFVVLGVILMILTRSTLVELLVKNKEKTNLDRVIGMTGIVTLEIKKNTVGEVKVDGKLWSAVSEKKIKVGEEVKVVKIDGVKLVVEKILEEKEIKDKPTPKKISEGKKASSNTKQKNSSAKKKSTTTVKKTVSKKESK